MLGWVILSLIFPYGATSQIRTTVSFDKAVIERTTLKKGEKDYEQVDMKMAFRSSNVGKPDLPVFYYKFFVPKEKVVTGVTYESSGISQLKLDYDLLSCTTSGIAFTSWYGHII